jgi:hypothetical protein
MRALIASKTIVGVNAIAIRDHFGVVVGVSFGGGTRGCMVISQHCFRSSICTLGVYVLGAGDSSLLTQYFPNVVWDLFLNVSLRFLSREASLRLTIISIQQQS